MSRIVLCVRNCLSRQTLRELRILQSRKWSTGVAKSVFCVSGGCLGVYSFWTRRKTLLCITSTAVDEKDCVIQSSSVNTTELDTTRPTGNTFLQNVVIVFRLSYLFILFSPAVLLHLTSFLFDSSSIRNMKWSYVRFALQRAGPAFVKLGQWISTRRDIFPLELCNTLSTLQKNCYTHSWKHTERILEDELGENWRDYFEETNPVPIGSGCVAQVYKWVLSDEGAAKASGRHPPSLEGTNQGDSQHKMTVAIKVLHPGMHTSISRDLGIMKFVASLMDGAYPDFYWISLNECVNEFSLVMEKQVDMELEAHNISKFRRNFSGHENIVFPKVIHSFVSQSILVESFEEGTHIGEFINGCNPDIHKSLAEVGIDTLLSMLFVHNFVHCDLHPGNILVRLPSDPNDTPTLVILDCGVATSLSKRDWSIFFDLFMSIVKGDSKKVADLMLDNAEFSNCQNVEKYRNEMDQLITDAIQQLNLQSIDVSGLLSRLFEVLIKNMVKLEASFTSVMLAVMVIEGLGRSLDPEMDILEAAKPFLLKSVKRQIMDAF